MSGLCHPAIVVRFPCGIGSIVGLAGAASRHARWPGLRQRPFRANEIAGKQFAGGQDGAAFKTAVETELRCRLRVPRG
ncbi:MAG: hypothetical protein EA381_20370 [Planctomycetaceae bacterium]|nr:MAG: hypothetical protein EA381_20370 [Planctomycetaceae bacterium]